MSHTVRVRFAPSPTGIMHLGNVRTALMNYLFAQQKKGTFILRIEDTDQKRNLEHAQEQIFNDLDWLGLAYQEGPRVGGDYGPYLQSERDILYQEKLNVLIENKHAYRCFCTSEELEKKEAMQRAAHLPPRYDRTCLRLTDEQITEKLEQNIPWIWRFKIDTNKQLSIYDLSKGTITFDMKNFSDFAITKRDGSFNFIFVNFVDDWYMKVTHVIRGGDHLSNTGSQAALYDLFNVTPPTFWHLVIICNHEGRKLSKRDFGFALLDLKNAGYLPEAIVNYLAILGGSFTNEIMSLEELAGTLNFEHVSSASAVHYDLEKLRWLNHEWIMRCSPENLLKRCWSWLIAVFPQAEHIQQSKLLELIKILQPELKTLADITTHAAFFFQEPSCSREELVEHYGEEAVANVLNLITMHLDLINQPETFLLTLKQQAKERNIAMKHLLTTLRYLLTGHLHGIGINELLSLLDQEIIRQRLGILK